MAEMSYQLRFIQQAIEEACHGVQSGDGGPFASVIVQNGEKVIARAHNMVMATKDPTAHAEIVAIRDACKLLNCSDLSGCVLYAGSYPCAMCLAACVYAKLDAIYYAFPREMATAAGFDDRQIRQVINQTDEAGGIRIEKVVLTKELAEPRQFELWNKTRQQN